MLSMWHHQCEPGSFIRTIQVWQVDALPEPVVCSLNASAQYQELRVCGWDVYGERTLYVFLLHCSLYRLWMALQFTLLVNR